MSLQTLSFLNMFPVFFSSRKCTFCSFIHCSILIAHCFHLKQLDDSLQKLVHVPLGNLHEFSTVRLISYFISTLNTMYHDFDFTNSEPNQFTTEKPEIVNQTINARLAPLAKSKPLLMESFWKNINSAMDLQQCMYSMCLSVETLKSDLNPFCNSDPTTNILALTHLNDILPILAF